LQFLISHRGNISGKSLLENSPDYIDNALEKGFDVEIDIRYTDNKLLLGHDKGQYPISLDWINERKNKLWVHCKDKYSIEYLNSKSSEIHFFFHEDDDLTITSKGFLWVFPGMQPVQNSIAVMPELYNDNIKQCIGVCSDFINNYK
tara:strand:+ start:1183 stop:1620 length:438 start_codon:yes stop_codon:yes gene_type:complete